MNKKVVVIALVAVACIIGSRAMKVRSRNYEDLRHQLERLWLDPKAIKARAKARAQAQR